MYGICTVYSVLLWRRGFRRDDWINYFLLLGAFGLHTTAMLLRGLSLQQCPVRNLYEATVFATWTIAGVYLIIGIWSRLRFLGAFAAPVLFGTGIFALIKGLDSSHGTAASGPIGTLTSIHAALLCLAYGAFGLGSVAACMYLSQEHNLKLHKLRALLSRLPPIQRLEVVISRLTTAGFILLTAGLAAGAYDLIQLSDPASYRGDAKIVWSAVVWFLYLALLVMRWRFAQGGRRFALGAIFSFAFVLLTFWGSNLLSPLHRP